MVSSLARGPRRGAAMLAAGALVALALSGSSGAMTQAAPALLCAPAGPTFGIFSGELQAQQDVLPAEVGCQGAGAPGPSNASSNDSARNSTGEQTYIYGQMAPAMSQQAQSDEESVWLEVYQAQANDQTR